MKNYHLILVRHHSRPDGSNCVRLRSDRFEQTVFIPYTNEPGEHTDPKVEAVKWLNKNGHGEITGQAELKDDYALIVSPNYEGSNGIVGFKPLK